MSIANSETRRRARRRVAYQQVEARIRAAEADLATLKAQPQSKERDEQIAQAKARYTKANDEKHTLESRI